MHNRTVGYSKSYLDASFRVWILLSLSLGSVGMILRKDWKASFRLCGWTREKFLVSLTVSMI